jgi:peptide/nickel transport system ATP-binding protein/oligopeptide transport system ATP-binding protein
MLMESSHLLDVKNLKVYFEAPGGKLLHAVDDVSFHVSRGEMLGIVGESGCGKSVTCMSILRLVETPPGRYMGGEIIFDGNVDTLKLGKKALRELRGARIAMIFQEPMAALNPVYTVGQQLCEAIRLHLPLDKAEAAELALDLLRQARVPDAKRVFESYAFTLSGGLRQRAMIAMALACKPDLLIADEPTTALDVTIQSHIMALIRRLREETGMAVILISHDLSLVSESADNILVMYAGRVCEYASTAEIVENPLHPYTRGLISSRPSGIAENNDKRLSRQATTTSMPPQTSCKTSVPASGNSHEQANLQNGETAGNSRGGRLRVIPGNVPSLEERPEGCQFHPRCDVALPRCAVEAPPETTVSNGHSVCCWQCVCGGDK